MLMPIVRGNPNNYIEISGQRIWYRQTGTSSWKSFILNSGEATICGVQQGAEYEFFTVYDGEYYEWSALANTTNFSETYQIPVNICNEMGF